MSRFEQDLERDLGQIADRATPSPDAWNSILERIETQEPITETEIIMLTDNTLTTRRWPLYAAAAAVVGLLIGGLVLVNRDDGTEVPATPPPPTAPVVEPEPEAETPDVVDTPLTLPEQGAQLTPGLYEVDTFGLPVSFEVPAATSSPWTVQVNDDIAISLGDDNGFVNMSRVGSFYDAEQAQNPEMSGLGSIAPDDIDGWIEANDITVDESRDVTVGGRSAQLRQVSAPEGAGQDSCPPEIQPCVSLSSASADQQSTYSGVSAATYGAFPHTFWLIELDDFEPLMIWAHTEGPETQNWLDEVTPLIESIVLGEPAPAVEGGTARLPERVAVTADMTITETGTPLSDEPWPVEWTGSLDGDITGTYVGTGMSSPNGAEVTLDWTMDATIEGIGTGTLTLRSDWAWTDPGDIAADEIISGTGDFEGLTGSGTSRQTSDNGFGNPYEATIELTLTLPAD